MHCIAFNVYLLAVIQLNQEFFAAAGRAGGFSEIFTIVSAYRALAEQGVVGEHGNHGVFLSLFSFLLSIYYYSVLCVQGQLEYDKKGNLPP